MVGRKASHNTRQSDRGRHKSGSRQWGGNDSRGAARSARKVQHLAPPPALVVLDAPVQCPVSTLRRPCLLGYASLGLSRGLGGGVSGCCDTPGGAAPRSLPASLCGPNCLLLPPPALLLAPLAPTVLLLPQLLVALCHNVILVMPVLTSPYLLLDLRLLPLHILPALPLAQTHCPLQGCHPFQDDCHGWRLRALIEQLAMPLCLVQLLRGWGKGLQG